MSNVNIDGVTFKHCMGSKDLSVAMARIFASRHHTKKFRAAIRNSCHGEAPIVIDEFLKTPELILAAAIAANMDIREHKRSTLERCLSMPDVLNVQKHISETDYVRARSKNHSDGFRVTHDFGLQHRTAQTMVKQAMSARFRPRRFQYTFLGVQKAIARTKLLLEQGLVYFATFDIKDHFGSFDLMKLAPVLPLHQVWVENVVAGRHLTVARDTRGLSYAPSIPNSLLFDQARRGIPQGSVCSPIVAAYCVAHLKWKSYPGVGLLNYADNFLLLATSQSGLAAGSKSLMDAIAELPGGQFTPKLVQTGRADDGFDYVGHHFRVGDFGIDIVPSVKNQDDIYEKLIHLDADFDCSCKGGDFQKAMKYLLKFSAVTQGWVAAFSQCSDVSEWTSTFDIHMEKCAKVLGMPLDELQKQMPCSYSISFREYLIV